jgi:hypothetical protein
LPFWVQEKKPQTQNPTETTYKQVPGGSINELRILKKKVSGRQKAFEVSRPCLDIGGKFQQEGKVLAESFRDASKSK